MRFARKFVAESFGVAETSRGGMVSLGPPDGGIILAQPVCKVVQKITTDKTIKKPSKEVFPMKDKHKAFQAEATLPFHKVRLKILERQSFIRIIDNIIIS